MRAMRSGKGRVPHVDQDGVTVTRTGNVRTGVWLLVSAMVVIGIMLMLVVGPFLADRPSVAAPRHAEQVAQPSSRGGASIPPAAGPRAAAASRRPQLPPALERRAAGAPPAKGQRNASADEGDSGDPRDDEGPSGIALFPPPGTDPIKPGIVVPDDFELPPGFVRHYQTTDDGKPLPAILMFHPDYAPVDAHGEKIALPADRVVPPEMAPPGLPHKMLDVPDDTVPMVEGPNDRH